MNTTSYIITLNRSEGISHIDGFDKASGKFWHKHVSSVLLGAGLAIAGNLLISIALNTQRYAHLRQAEEKDKRHYLKSWVWWVGILLMAVGELGNFAAYSFAPASLVAPLGMTTVLANAAIAVLFLKEKIRSDDVLGAALAIVGAFLIINFCSKDEPAVGLSGKVLIHLLRQPALLMYLAVEVITVALLLYFREKKYPDNVIVVLLISSLIGSWTVISAKAVAGLLRSTLHGNSQLGQPLLYLMAIILGVTAVLQVKFLNQAMKENPATVVVPTNFVFFTLSAIIGGVVFYQEFYGLQMLEIVMFLLGCFFCFGGVYFITGRREMFNVEKLMSPVYILAPSSPLYLTNQTQRFILLQPMRQPKR